MLVDVSAYDLTGRGQPTIRAVLGGVLCARVDLRRRHDQAGASGL